MWEPPNGIHLLRLKIKIMRGISINVKSKMFDENDFKA
jgi:hypothetical protein